MAPKKVNDPTPMPGPGKGLILLIFTIIVVIVGGGIAIYNFWPDDSTTPPPTPSPSPSPSPSPLPSPSPSPPPLDPDDTDINKLATRINEVSENVTKLSENVTKLSRDVAKLSNGGGGGGGGNSGEPLAYFSGTIDSATSVAKNASMLFTQTQTNGLEYDALSGTISGFEEDKAYQVQITANYVKQSEPFPFAVTYKWVLSNGNHTQDINQCTSVYDMNKLSNEMAAGFSNGAVTCTFKAIANQEIKLVNRKVGGTSTSKMQSGTSLFIKEL